MPKKPSKNNKIKELFSGVGKKRSIFVVIMFLVLICLICVFFKIKNVDVTVRANISSPASVASGVVSDTRTLASSDGCYYVGGIYVCGMDMPTPTPTSVPTSIYTPTPVVTVAPTPPTVPTASVSSSPATSAPTLTPKSTATPTSQTRATATPKASSTAVPATTQIATPAAESAATATPSSTSGSTDDTASVNKENGRLSVPETPRIPSDQEIKALRETAPYQLRKITEQDFTDIMQGGNTYDILVLWQFSIRHPRVSGMTDAEYLSYQIDCFNQELENQRDSQLVEWWLSGYKKDITKQNANQLFVQGAQNYKNGVIDYNKISATNEVIVDQIAKLDVGKVQQYKDSVAFASKVAQDVAGTPIAKTESNYMQSVLLNKHDSCVMPPCPVGAMCIQVCPKIVNPTADELFSNLTQDNKNILDQLVGQNTVMKKERILGIPTGNVVPLTNQEMNTVKGEYANTCAAYDEADKKAEEARQNGQTPVVSIIGFASCTKGIVAW